MKGWEWKTNTYLCCSDDPGSSPACPASCLILCQLWPQVLWMNHFSLNNGVKGPQAELIYSCIFMVGWFSVKVSFLCGILNINDIERRKCSLWWWVQLVLTLWWPADSRHGALQFAGDWSQDWTDNWGRGCQSCTVTDRQHKESGDNTPMYA